MIDAGYRHGVRAGKWPGQRSPRRPAAWNWRVSARSSL